MVGDRERLRFMIRIRHEQLTLYGKSTHRYTVRRYYSVIYIKNKFGLFCIMDNIVVFYCTQYV